MKKLLIVLTAGIFCCLLTKAQTTDTAKTKRPKRHVPVTFIGKDSVNLAFNEDFDRIEDSCSVIIRHAHIDKKDHKFYGKIKDVSTLDTSVILTEGNYAAGGLKDGYFVTHYINGQLQAKGNFKNNEYDGKWETYYEDGKPKVFFEANGKDIKITEAWDAKGAKVVDNGKGTYRNNMGRLYWTGKLVNGKPDGSWAVIKTDDATNTEVVTEKYKNGVFQKGSGALGTYTDAPRVELISANMLPFTEAELLHISRVPCNGTKRKHIVHAQYNNGTVDFSEHIKMVVRPFFSRINIREYELTFALEGEIAENGLIVKLHSSTSNFRIADELAMQLDRLPALQPATIDGKPAREKFVINFTLDKGFYRFNYRFLDVYFPK